MQKMATRQLRVDRTLKEKVDFLKNSMHCHRETRASVWLQENSASRADSCRS